MVDLAAIGTTLTEVEPGLWSSSEVEEVSYPSDAHRLMAEVEDESFWFAHRSRVLEQVVSRFPPPGCLFDVGGGNGYMVRALRRNGLEAVLVEPGEEGARTGLLRGLVPVINSSAAAAGFREESLPAVGLFDVLEHIADAPAFLSELRRVMRPDGRLYLTVPTYRWLWSVDDVRAGHFRRYTAGSLHEMLAGSGFDLEYSSYFFTVLPLPIFAARTVPSWLGRRDADHPHTAEHQRPGGPVGAALAWVLDRELQRLSHDSLPFGSSLIAVARRSSEN